MPYTIRFERQMAFFNAYQKKQTERSPATSAENASFEFYDNLFAAVYAIIGDYCNQPLYQQSVTHIFCINDGRHVLPFLRVPVAITGFTTQADMFATPQNVAGSNYTLKNNNGVYYLYYQNLNSGYDATLQITAGYADAVMPEDLLLITAEMASVILAESPRGENLLMKQAIGETLPSGGRTTTFKDMAAKFEARLAPYRVEVS